MHPDCKEIIDNENRAYRAKTKLSKLNKHFTVLVNRFTKCKYPEKINLFSTSVIDKIGTFNMIDIFSVSNLEFQVLESHGGHIPGQVFFLNREQGLFFTLFLVFSFIGCIGKCFPTIIKISVHLASYFTALFTLKSEDVLLSKHRRQGLLFFSKSTGN